MGGCEKNRIFVENWGGVTRGTRGKWGVGEGLWGFLVKNWGFYGKRVGFSKNGGFVGFWPRNRGKVGKSREFDDFLKIGENGEK